MYESMLVLAIAFSFGGLLHTLTWGGLAGIPRPAIQIYLFPVLGAYFYLVLEPRWANPAHEDLEAAPGIR